MDSDSRKAAIEGMVALFTNYANSDNWDERTAILAHLILEETRVNCAGLTDEEREVRMATEARRLFKLLPQSKEYFPAFLKTRALLWRQEMKGLVLCTGADRDEFTPAIFSPGTISAEERKILCEIIEKELKSWRDSTWIAHLTRNLLQEFPCDDAQLRTLMHFFASKAPIYMLRKLVS